jgi:hypothetical protein
VDTEADEVIIEPQRHRDIEKKRTAFGVVQSPKAHKRDRRKFTV